VTIAMSMVSVCIPAYDPGPYLLPAVKSVLAQAYSDFELLIVDDASDPPISSILEGVDDPRIRLHRNEANLGLTGNWNRCLELARGRCITVFHQDDVMRCDNLSAKVGFLDSHPSVGMVYSNIERIDADGCTIGGHWTDQPQADTVMKGSEMFALIARQGNPVSCPSVLVRSDCYRELGPFDPRLAFAVDLEMWLRIASRYDVGYIADPLIQQRQHPEQETVRFAGSGRDYEDVLKALDIAFAAGLPKDCARHAQESYRTLASQAWPMTRWKLRQGRLDAASRYMLVTARAGMRCVLQKSRGR